MKAITRKELLRSLLLLVTMVMMGTAFIACSDDDDDDGGSGGAKKELVGTWEFSTGTETVMGQTITIDRSMLKEIERQMEQMAGQNIEFWDVTLRITESHINGVPYKLKGSQILMEGMDMEGLSFKVSVKSVSETKLVLHEVIEMQGMTIQADMTYTK